MELPYAAGVKTLEVEVGGGGGGGGGICLRPCTPLGYGGGGQKGLYDVCPCD